MSEKYIYQTVITSPYKNEPKTKTELRIAPVIKETKRCYIVECNKDSLYRSRIPKEEACLTAMEAIQKCIYERTKDVETKSKQLRASELLLQEALDIKLDLRLEGKNASDK